METSVSGSLELKKFCFTQLISVLRYGEETTRSISKKLVTNIYIGQEKVFLTFCNKNLIDFNTIFVLTFIVTHYMV